MKYIFYFLPCLLNVVIGLFFFITAKRMADANLSSLAVTATLPMWALIYAASSFIIGKYANKNNAVKILFVSQMILLISMLGLLFIPSVKLQYFWLLASGLGTGLFFAPFQTVVKLFEKSGTFAGNIFSQCGNLHIFVELRSGSGTFDRCADLGAVRSGKRLEILLHDKYSDRDCGVADPLFNA